MTLKKSILVLLLSLPTIVSAGITTETLYLSGTGFDNTVEWDFYCSAGMNSGHWTKIQVPSCWEQQGFGEYNYGHVPFDERLKEEGQYRHSFHAPASWKGKHVRLVFDGVMTDCEVALNGRTVGEVHQGAFYRFGYDVSHLLKLGKENRLEVKVKKFSDNTSVNEAERKADYWVFGGIFRPVYLEVKPQEHIERVATDARADGSIAADVVLSATKVAAAVEMSILDDEGRERVKFSGALPNRSEKVRLRGNLDKPELWSPEFPNLYTAVFRLLDRQGNILHETSERIGFRSVEVREQDGIYVNGVRIRFKGVDRHSFHPDHGRTSCRTLSIEAVNLIKDMNMNAVRMSHYPPDTHFLDACDSLGLFVLDELAGWQRPPYDSVVGRKLLGEMIARDVNHPSVVMWDNGNERGWNTSYDKDFRGLDIQQREVHHPGALFGKSNLAHYPDYDYLSLDHFAPRKIFFPTEMLHGLYDGGLGAGLEDFWLRMWQNPLCAGGFLWVFADEAVKRNDTGELDSDGNHAPDGILGPYHEKEGSFYTIREIWSPLFIEKRYITPEFNGIFKIENRYHYTALNKCSYRYRWMTLPDPGETGDMDLDGAISGAVLSEGTPQVDPLQPGQSGILKVELPDGWENADVLYLEAHDPHGRFLHRWSWPVRSPEARASGLLDPAIIAGGIPGTVIDLVETPARLIFESSGIHVELSKETGMLEKIVRGGRELLFSGGWLIGHEKPVVEELDIRREIDALHIGIRLEDESRFEWIFHANGLLDLNIRYTMEKDLVDHAGITFSFPEESMEAARYLGNGPYRVWKNRMAGVTFNVWEKAYNNTITGYEGYEYPEFKGYYSDLYWVTFRDNQEQEFTVFCRTEDVFLRLYSPGEAPDPAKTSVKHPSGDNSFMHGIPAIGTKFKTAEQLGPQSRPYQYHDQRIPDGALNMSLTFDFRTERFTPPGLQ